MKRQNKLGSYLAVTAGVGCVSSVANAATVVSLGSVPAPLSDPIFTAEPGFGNYFSIDFNATLSIDVDFDDIGSFGIPYLFSGDSTGGPNSTEFSSGNTIFYTNFFGDNGASLGTDNFASFSALDSDENAIDFVAQFFIDFEGNGSLLAIASNPANTPLSFEDGVAAIQAAQVPEPSSLALLALGSKNKHSSHPCIS